MFRVSSHDAGSFVGGCTRPNILMVATVNADKGAYASVAEKPHPRSGEGFSGADHMRTLVQRAVMRRMELSNAAKLGMPRSHERLRLVELAGSTYERDVPAYAKWVTLRFSSVAVPPCAYIENPVLAFSGKIRSVSTSSPCWAKISTEQWST